MLQVVKLVKLSAALAAIGVVVFGTAPAFAAPAYVIRSDGTVPNFGSNPELGDTGTSCQENPDDAASAGGTICGFADATSGAPPGLQIAERFTFITSGDITGVSWSGFFADPAIGTCDLPVAPAENDKWTIRYYLDDDNGFPGVMIAEFIDVTLTDGLTRVDTGRDVGTGIGPLSVFDMHYDFPTPVPVEGGLFYHLEISSNYDFNACFFCWEVAPPGDGMALQGTIGQPYTADDITTYDVAQCQQFSSGGGGQLPPSVALELIRPPDIDTGCCQFEYTVRNRNSPGFGPLETFYMAVARGNAPAGCEDISNITPPVGFTVSFCEDWSNNDIAIFKFEGGSLPEQQSTHGQIRTRVNGPQAVILDADNGIPSFGIRAWGSQSDPGLACGTGTFGPLGDGEWNAGMNAICPFQPIPSFSTMGKGVLVLLLAVGGLLLVVRSRTVPAGQTI